MQVSRQIPAQEAIVSTAKVVKEDCLTIEEAAVVVDCSKATLYNYMNILGTQRFKFSFDRKTYVMKSDVARIKEFITTNKG